MAAVIQINSAVHERCNDLRLLAITLRWIGPAARDAMANPPADRMRAILSKMDHDKGQERRLLTDAPRNYLGHAARRGTFLV